MFTVYNNGTGVLNPHTPVLPAGFHFGINGLMCTIGLGSFDSFDVVFKPTAFQDYGGEISIVNNDSDEDPYNFAIFGIGGEPEIDVQGKGVSIVENAKRCQRTVSIDVFPKENRGIGS